MPEASTKIISLRGGQKNRIAIYDIKSLTSKGMLNIAAHYISSNFDNKGFPPILLATRYINGEYFFNFMQYELVDVLFLH